MLPHSRFACPSAGLGLNALLRRTGEAVWVGLSLAVVGHLLLGQIERGHEQQRVAKPLTTQFVKRQPRLTKPLELRKRPQPKRRILKRRMVTLPALARGQGLRRGIQAIEVLGSLVRPRTSLSASLVWPGAGVEPEVLAEGVWGTRDARESADMSLELMDVYAMDTGRYHAMVIQDPSDKRAIRGFIHVAMCDPLTGGLDDNKQWRWRRGVQNLSQFINKHTAIRSDVNKYISFDSADLFDTPWVYLCRLYRFDVTQSELHNLGRYMLSGGFFWGDSFGLTPIYVGGHKSMDHTIIKSLETQGFVYEKDWTYQLLPNSHPILHCYFDFDTPPLGWGASSKIWGQHKGWDTTPDLHGVVVDGAVVALKTRQSYANAWGDWGPGGLHESYRYLDPTRCLQFGVNTIIYALTREGSITHRVMDAVR